MIRKLSFEELIQSRPTPAIARDLPRFPMYGVVENVRSLYNVGAIFRTADGAGLQKLYLCGITGKPPHEEIHKTALGAEENVPWEYLPQAVTIIQQLKSRGVQIVVLEHTTASFHFQKAQFRTPCCLVVGHEHLGVSDEVVALADLAIEIPMYGLKGSLNVAVAFGIAAYQMVWQLQKIMREF
jgi:tRNA G18 (ribose-2'-O)-methylase SpoU